MQLLRQSTAITVKLGPFVDETDGFTAEGSLTISQADVRLSKNGGDFAQKNQSSSASHDENGYYDVSLDTTDTGTLGRLRVAVSEGGARPVVADFMVVPANTYNSLVGGSDFLNVNISQVEEFDAAAALFGHATIAPVAWTSDDATAGTVLVATIEAMSAGNKVKVGPGNYNIGTGAGTATINCPAGVTIEGQGRVRIYSDDDTTNVPLFRTEGKDVVVKNITFDATPAGVNSGVSPVLWSGVAHVENVRFDDCHFLGTVDAFHPVFTGSGTTVLYCNDCIFESQGGAGTSTTTDNTSLTPIAGTVIGHFNRCHWITEGATNSDTINGTVLGGTGTAIGYFHDCTWDVNGNKASSVAKCVTVSVAAAEAHIKGGRATVTNSTGTAYALLNVTTGTVDVASLDYLSSATSGTITDNTSPVIDSKLGTPSVDLATDLAAITGLNQSRINTPADIVVQLASRRDGTFVCVPSIDLLPGSFDSDKQVDIDVRPYYGNKARPANVGTPTVSGGSITCTALGPKDEFACVLLGGTATASEERTIDVPITMDNGGQTVARLVIEVGAS